MNTRKTFGIAIVGVFAAGILGACAPEAPPVTTIPPGGDTTTTNVEYACAGTGIIGPGGASPVGPIADQTTDIAITLPASATVGVAHNVSVDVGNLDLAPAPAFIDLNSAGILATVSVAGAGDVVVAADNFVGNGTSIDLVAGGSDSDVAVAGTNTVTVGDIVIVSGSTGFACSPTGAGASASVEAV